eukprot:scaffold5545_cov68-Phaeocystis_antarctica.AAC.3
MSRPLIVGRKPRFRWPAQPRCAQPPRTLHERATEVAGAAAEQQQQQPCHRANREEHGQAGVPGLQHVVVQPGEQIGRADHGGDHGRAAQRHGAPLHVLDSLDAHQLGTDQLVVLVGVGADVRACAVVEPLHHLHRRVALGIVKRLGHSERLEQLFIARNALQHRAAALRFDALVQCERCLPRLGHIAPGLVLLEIHQLVLVLGQLGAAARKREAHHAEAAAEATDAHLVLCRGRQRRLEQPRAKAVLLATEAELLREPLSLGVGLDLSPRTNSIVLDAQSTLELVEAPRHPLYRLARPLERRYSAGENDGAAAVCAKGRRTCASSEARSACQSSCTRQAAESLGCISGCSSSAAGPGPTLLREDARLEKGPPPSAEPSALQEGGFASAECPLCEGLKQLLQQLMPCSPCLVGWLRQLRARIFEHFRRCCSKSGEMTCVERVASLRVACSMVAPVKLAPLRSAPLKRALLTLTPVRFVGQAASLTLTIERE